MYRGRDFTDTFGEVTKTWPTCVKMDKKQQFLWGLPQDVRAFTCHRGLEQTWLICKAPLLQGTFYARHLSRHLLCKASFKAPFLQVPSVKRSRPQMKTMPLHIRKRPVQRHAWQGCRNFFRSIWLRNHATYTRQHLWPGRIPPLSSWR